MRTQIGSFKANMATDIAQKIRALINARDIKDTALAKAVGVQSSAINRWTTLPSEYRPGDSVRRPSIYQLLKIARYFGVSMEYLADDEMDEPEGGISPDERAVLAAYRVQRRKEGESFDPEELAWRIMEPRTVAPEVIDGKTGQVKKLNPATGRHE